MDFFETVLNYFFNLRLTKILTMSQIFQTKALDWWVFLSNNLPKNL